ncbi:MAG: hypothetical protein KGS48_10440 [Bacteroidetes bacterium]|nr:hypothetical protein [Bacteroidota bacterium]
MTIPDLDVAGVRTVVDALVQEYETLECINRIQYVQMFENKYTVMGCSNPQRDITPKQAVKQLVGR